MYQSKMSRPHESRSSTGGPSFSSYRFAGDASEILQEESRKCIAEMSQELAVLDNSQLNEFQYLAHTRRLLNEEINKVTTNMNPDWLDVESSKASVKVLKRVLLPRTKPGVSEKFINKYNKFILVQCCWSFDGSWWSNFEKNVPNL